jgi:hypothetical protein
MQSKRKADGGKGQRTAARAGGGRMIGTRWSFEEKWRWGMGEWKGENIVFKRTVGEWITTQCCVTSQKSADVVQYQQFKHHISCYTYIYITHSTKGLP